MVVSNKVADIGARDTPARSQLEQGGMFACAFFWLVELDI